MRVYLTATGRRYRRPNRADFEDSEGGRDGDRSGRYFQDTSDGVYSRRCEDIESIGGDLRKSNFRTFGHEKRWGVGVGVGVGVGALGVLDGDDVDRLT